MADVEIISSSTCPFAQRTRMALIEKGIPFDLTAIDLNDKPEWFLEISPYGKVPVLRHNGAVIFESAVINEYLEEVFPDSPMLPRDPVRRAQARIWIDFANVRFTPLVYKLMLAQEADAQVALAERLTDALLAMIEASLRPSGEDPLAAKKTAPVALSRIQKTVLHLVAQGLSNAEIGQQRGTSLRATTKLLHTLQAEHPQLLLDSKYTRADSAREFLRDG